MFNSVLSVFFRLCTVAIISIPMLATATSADIKKVKSVNNETAPAAMPIKMAAPLSEYGITSVALESQNQRLREEVAKRKIEQVDMQKRLAAQQNELDALIAKATEAAQPPSTAEAKMAYVAGQSMVSGINGRLEGWEAVDVKVDSHWFEIGLIDGLEDAHRLDQKTFDDSWKEFADRVQSGVQDKMKVSDAALRKEIGERVPARTKNGVTYLVINKGQPLTDIEAPVRLSLHEQVLGGDVISEVPSLTISADDTMPSVVRDALPLLGTGSDIVAYGLAKSVYGSLPLPDHVQPFTVLEYHFKGLKAN